jgi:hypothetical protein
MSGFFSTVQPLTFPNVGEGQTLEYREAGQWYRATLISPYSGSVGLSAGLTNSAPTSSTGKVGDYYLYIPGGLTAPRLYGPKQSNNTWPLIGKSSSNPNSPEIAVGWTDGGVYGPDLSPSTPYDPGTTNPTYIYNIQIGLYDSLYYGHAIWVYNTVAGWYPTSSDKTLDSVSDVVVSSAQTDQVLIWDGTKWVNGNVDAADVVYDNDTSGLTATDVQAAIDELVQGLDGQNEASEITYDNTSSGLVATDVQAAIDEVLDSLNDASEIAYDNDTSGLDATDVQAAIDEVVDEKLNVPGFVLWESLDWETLISGAGAPTSSNGGPGWYYLDTTPGSEELYGPAFFDGGIPGWNWGTALANFTFSATGPTNEAGDWYVWDENGDGSVYTLFQKKTAINFGDMLFWSGVEWEARSQQISANNVYADLTNIDPNYGVDSIQTQLQNLFSNYAQAYNGGNSYFVETNIDTTHTVSPYDGNGHVLTLVNDTTISFASAWDPTSQLGTRFAELTIVLIWDTNVKVASGVSLTTTADAVDMLKAVSWDNGTTWYVTQIGADFT